MTDKFHVEDIAAIPDLAALSPESSAAGGPPRRSRLLRWALAVILIVLAGRAPLRPQS